MKRNNAGGKALTSVRQLNLENSLNKNDRDLGCKDMGLACSIIDRCPQGYLNFFCTDKPLGGYESAPAFFIIDIPKNK